MNLPLYIAKRYLFAKKSHNVINIISAISVIGMAVGTAALIIILSVYNGFGSLVRASLGSIEPDILISPAHGKAFVPEGEAFEWLYRNEDIATMCSVIEENVYISYDGRNGIAKAKGVDVVYEEESPLHDNIVEGKFSLHRGDVPQAVVGQGLAQRMGISAWFLSGLEVYFPSRSGRFSPSDPTSSLNAVKLWPAGLFRVNSDTDNELIVMPLEKMRELMEYDDEVTGVELRFAPGLSADREKRLISELRERLGDGFIVKDRMMQNESVYKMMRYEKTAITLILIFVIIIVAFNIFGSLTMLIIEKGGDIETLRSLGAEDRLIKRIFLFEGWMISLLGLVVGLVLGVLLVWLQARFGFVKMPGSFQLTSYPVILQAQDILLTIACVATIGYIIALIPAKRIQWQ